MGSKSCTDKGLWGNWGSGGCSTSAWPLPNLGLEKYLVSLYFLYFFFLFLSSELLGTFLSLYPFHVVNRVLADSRGNCFM